MDIIQSASMASPLVLKRRPCSRRDKKLVTASGPKALFLRRVVGCSPRPIIARLLLSREQMPVTAYSCRHRQGSLANQMPIDQICFAAIACKFLEQFCSPADPSRSSLMPRPRAPSVPAPPPAIRAYKHAPARRKAAWSVSVRRWRRAASPRYGRKSGLRRAGHG